MMRNEPVGDHHAHLFQDGDVASVENQYDVMTASVQSLCGRRNSFGPFSRVDAGEAGEDGHPDWLCGRCVQIWAGQRRQRAADGGNDEEAL